MSYRVQSHFCIAFEIILILAMAYAGTGKPNIELEFLGLDTFCDIYVNGEKLMSTQNMFHEHILPLDPLKLKIENQLLLIFHPARKISRALQAKMGTLVGGSVNLGDKSRLYVRKAAYHYRWDWGPELLCVGPWQPVILHCSKTRISSFKTSAIVDEDLSCSLQVEVSLNGPGQTTIQVKDPQSKIILEEKISSDLSIFKLPEAQLWWPRGHGSQPRYTVTATVSEQASTRTIDSQSRKIGFRRAQLVQDPLPENMGGGTTFLFEINRKRIWIGGSNWIPGDSFLPTMNPDRYRAWLQLMVNGNQNMVRVWGGGVYEPDCFYDICDEIGLLVWQDFMFACGSFPVHDEFIKAIKVEAELAVTRLAHHPSIVLFCGGNENYQQVKQWKINEEQTQPLPSVLIYESVLPEVVERLTNPEILYHRDSPWGGKGWDTTDPTTGDIHQWNVWADKELPYQDYDVLTGRFVSEFGIPSLPDLRTIDFWLNGDSKERHPQSRLMQNHNKAGKHERRLAIYMNENFRINGDLESYAYLTQLMQSEAISFAYRSWKRKWMGKGAELNGGALVWQINDCWPVSSWAIVDYYLRPKLSFFTIARALTPVSVGIARSVVKDRENDRPRQFYEYGAFQSLSATVDVWAVSDGEEPLPVKLRVNAHCLETGWSSTSISEHLLGPNCSTPLLVETNCPQPSKDNAFDPLVPSGTVVLQALLLNIISGEVLSRYCDWPQPLKFLDLECLDGKSIVQIDRKGETLECRSVRPVKGLWFTGPDGLPFSDNALDLMPGDVQTVSCKGLQDDTKIAVRFLGCEKSYLI